MHIALISSRYTPETSPGAKRVTDLASALHAAGHRTTVLTQLPHYPDPQAFAGFDCDDGPLTIRDEGEGNAVWRYRPRLAAKGNLVARLCAEARFAYRSSRYGTGLSGLDGVFATSPYIFSLWSARTFPAPMWLDLRDLTWEYSRELGPHGLLYGLGYRAVKALALRCFRAAARISTTTERQRQYLIDQGIAPRKIGVVPNGVPRAIVEDLERLRTAPRPDGPLRLVYAGLLGFPQGLAFVVESLEQMPDCGVELHVYGDGVDRAALTAYCQSRKLGHIRFHGHVAYPQYLQALSTADILYASLRPGGSLVAAMPSKIWEYMAAAKPVLFAGGGEAAEAIHRAEAGLCVPYGDQPALHHALRCLQRDAAARQQYGENGRRWVVAHQVRETINTDWVSAMSDVFRPGRSRQSVGLSRMAAGEANASGKA